MSAPDSIVDSHDVGEWRRNGNDKPTYDEMPITSLLDVCSFAEPSTIESDEACHDRQTRALEDLGRISADLSPARREVLSRNARLIMVDTWGWNDWEARGAVQAVQKGFLSFSKPPTPRETIIETIDALLDADDVDDTVPWVLEGYLAEADLTILAGNPKAGKTTFASHIAQAVAKGSRFLDRATRQQTVLWIDMEQGRRKMRAMMSALDVRGLPIHVWQCRGQRPTPEQIREKIGALGAGLVVIDSLSKLWEGYVENENDNSETDRYLNIIGWIAEETGATFLLVHHTRKEKGAENTDVRGSQAINQNAGISVVVRKMEKGEGNARLLTAISRYDETPSALVVAREDDGYRVVGTEAEAIDADREHKVEDALRGMTEGLTVGQLCDATELKDGVTRKTCLGMEDKGSLHKLGKGGKADPFRYVLVGKGSSFTTGGVREKEKTTSDDDLEARYAELGAADG